MGHHHGSHTPTSPEAILLGKMAHHTKQIRRECNLTPCQLIWPERVYNSHYNNGVVDTFGLSLIKLNPRLR